MDKRHLPFREIEPEEGNVVVSISYSGTGHAFLVCTAGSQPKVRTVMFVGDPLEMPPIPANPRLRP